MNRMHTPGRARAGWSSVGNGRMSFDERPQPPQHRVIVVGMQPPEAGPDRAPREPAPTVGFRALVAGAGLRRIVRWGDFKPQLAAQLTHPERLQDGHQLDCLLQLYEITAAIEAAALASAVLGSRGRSAELSPLTPDRGAALQLPAAVCVQSNGRANDGGAAERAFQPGDRVFRLSVVSDPTRAPAPLVAAPSGAVPLSADPRIAAANVSAAPRLRETTLPQRTKTAIPEQFARPWDFQLSRDDAVSAMNFAGVCNGALRRLQRSLRSWLTGFVAVRRWRLLLSGRSLDEQLWAVSPPRDGLACPRVREWARRTLVAAGYEPDAMLAEWEIYWRRKGVRD